jgi:signal recognition particle receptor subunit beta
MMLLMVHPLNWVGVSKSPSDEDANSVLSALLSSKKSIACCIVIPVLIAANKSDQSGRFCQ